MYRGQSLHYSELPAHAFGCELYQVVQEETGVPPELQILVHRGKLVHPAKPLFSQSFAHGGCESVFVLTKCKGGGDDPPNSDYPPSGNASDHLLG